MSDSPSKAIDVKSKARVADQPQLSAQAQKRAKNEEDENKIQHDTLNHMLEHIKHDPHIFQREEMKYLRIFLISLNLDVTSTRATQMTLLHVLFYALTFPIH